LLDLEGEDGALGALPVIGLLSFSKDELLERLQLAGGGTHRRIEAVDDTVIDESNQSVLKICHLRPAFAGS
jgi:hypothetical protein